MSAGPPACAFLLLLFQRTCSAANGCSLRCCLPDCRTVCGAGERLAGTAARVSVYSAAAVIASPVVVPCVGVGLAVGVPAFIVAFWVATTTTPESRLELRARRLVRCLLDRASQGTAWSFKSSQRAT